MDSEKCKLGYVGLRDMGLGYTGTRERWHVVTRGQKDKGTRGRDKQTSPDFCAKCVKHNFRSVQKVLHKVFTGTGEKYTLRYHTLRSLPESSAHSRNKNERNIHIGTTVS